MDERKALEGMIGYIVEERSRLWTEYTRIVKRLGELDSENKNVENKKVSDEKQKRSMTILEAVEKHNKQFQLEEEEEEEEEVTPFQNIKSDIEVAKERESENTKVTNTPTKTSDYKDNKQISYMIVSILKEAGRPMKVGEIIKSFESRGIKSNSPYSTFHQALRYQSRIEKAKFGYYQYKW